MAALFGDVPDLTPHGFCLAWQPGLIWLQAGSDAAIALAYYSIPLALLSLMRRRGDLAYPWMFGLFAAFILACGTTHVMAVVTLWRPLYWIDGGLKALTALLSLATAAILWPLLPHALALPSPRQLRGLNVELEQQVAEREAAVARLQRSEARHRTLYARTPAALHTLDLDGRIVAVNEHWQELLGYESHAVLGRWVGDLLDPATVDGFAGGWAHLLGGGALREVERRMVCKDGRMLDVLVSATVERDADGRPLQVMTAITDVTQRRATEAALRASEERLRQASKMQAVGQLTGGIAHDFNNMLTVVMANLELLQDWLPDDPRALRLTQNAVHGAERAARLTAQLLSFSRQQRLEPQPLDVVAVVLGVQELLARTLGESGRLVVDGRTGSDWRCLVDRNQLESALLNLVLNARAALPGGGGEVRIAVAERRLTAAHLASTELQDEDAPPAGEYVVLSVSDTGTGMTDTIRRRAVEPFFSTKAAGQGTGLGLSQIYGFVRQSGGALRLDSAPGEGTHVELLFPRVTAPSLEAGPTDATAAAGRPMPPTRAAGSCVLVVEDEAGLRDVVVEALRERGWEVWAAGDGSDGLACLDAHPEIALLFTDVAMPGGLNGVDLALEARRRRPDMPVLFATGYADLSVMARWPGQAEVLAKPYAVSALALRLRAALAA